MDRPNNLCSRCKKNLAVLFITKIENGESKNVLCFVTDADKPRITTSRDVLGRINYDLPEKMFLSEDSESFGEVRDSCVRCIFDITIEAGSKKRVRFSIAAGQNKEQASLAAERTLLINSGKTGRLLTDTAGAGAEGAGLINTSWMSIIMLVVVALVFYFFMYRPQKKQENETNSMRNGLQVGDEITTIGGIIGKIISIKDETVLIETGNDKNKIRILRSAVRSVDVKAEDAD